MEALSNPGDPQRLTKALQAVQNKMELDDAIQDPASESAHIVSEEVKPEVTSDIKDGNWQGALELLAQAKGNNLPLNDPVFLSTICEPGSREGYTAQLQEYCSQVQ